MDQAQGLRELEATRPIRCIAVTGGKGGVGKTNIAVNLAVSFAQKRKKVMLLDADFGLANIDVLLGLSASKTLEHVLNGDSELKDILLEGPRGISIVPASSGVKSMTSLSLAQQTGLITAFSEVASDVDVLIIDTAAGINESVTTFTRAAGEVVVVVCDEPTSVTDAYALIKVLSRDHGLKKISVLTNQVESKAHGEVLFNQLVKVASRFLDVSLQHIGSVPEDVLLKKAVKRQLAVCEAYPRSPSARAIEEICSRIDRTPVRKELSGGIEFFVERVAKSVSD